MPSAKPSPLPRAHPDLVVGMIALGALAVLGLWWRDTPSISGLGDWLTNAGRITGLLAGYAMAGSKSRSVVHSIGFAVVLTLTVYVILDLEFPRVGLIRVDATDQVLRDVRQSMR